MLTKSPTGAAADDARQIHCWYRFKSIPCWSTDIYAIALASRAVLIQAEDEKKKIILQTIIVIRK